MAAPDLLIEVHGEGGIQTLSDKGAVRSQKPIFRSFEPQFGLKVGGGGGWGCPRAPSLVPPLKTINSLFMFTTYHLLLFSEL